MTTVATHLAVLRRELGTVEKPPGSNCQPYSQRLGRPCEPWCADFQVDGARRSGLRLPSESAYTPAMADGFRKAGRWGSRPLVGALGFIYYPSKRRIAHVFMVEAIEADGSLITIEGNTHAAGGRSGGRVMRHRRSLHNVAGFGYPEYEREKPRAEPWEETLVKKLPTLKRGARGPHVRSAQALCVARGRSEVGVDDTFGPVTEHAIEKLTGAKVLDRAGWTKLLGL